MRWRADELDVPSGQDVVTKAGDCHFFGADAPPGDIGLLDNEDLSRPARATRAAHTSELRPCRRRRCHSGQAPDQIGSGVALQSRVAVYRSASTSSSTVLVADQPDVVDNGNIPGHPRSRRSAAACETLPLLDRGANCWLPDTTVTRSIG
jgi:hypothetical protein